MEVMPNIKALIIRVGFGDFVLQFIRGTLRNGPDKYPTSVLHMVLSLLIAGVSANPYTPITIQHLGSRNYHDK